MRTGFRFMPALAVAASATLLLTAAGCVTAYGQPRYGGYYGGYGDTSRIAYDNGYRRGIDHGLADARAGRDGDFRDDGDYRHADWGYEHGYGPRGQYRQQFRRGYESGYREGYSRYDGGYGPSGGYGRAVPRQGGYGYPDPRYGYPGRGDGGYGSYGYASPAYDKGRRDGYEKGRDDGEDGRAYDLLRHKWYREGDRGYDSRYGSREQYKDVYRDAFKQGYDEGFRQGQYRR